MKIEAKSSSRGIFTWPIISQKVLQEPDYSSFHFRQIRSELKIHIGNARVDLWSRRTSHHFSSQIPSMFNAKLYMLQRIDKDGESMEFMLLVNVEPVLFGCK